MLFSGINIKRELVRHRSAQTELFNEVKSLLAEAAENEKDIFNRLKKNRPGTGINISSVDSENIFSIEDIRHICIQYRLRFLDSGHFKSEYPYDAVAEIAAFEKKYDVKIQSFHIVAPAEAFDLENINKDPLLFAQLNDRMFYLIHQWGHDMKWYRRLISWPVQNFRNLLLTLFFSGALFSFSIPGTVMNIFSLQSEMYLRIWLSIHIFIGLTGLTLWAGLAFDKSLSEGNWNSKYYNY
jgi:hypothetical protein